VLFSSAMVKAILDGKKTMTRRVITGLAQSSGKPYWPGGKHGGDFLRVEHCPHGKSGDRLWVKETWRSWEETCTTSSFDQGEDHRCTEHCRQTYVAYAATPRVGYRPVPDKARITYLDETTPLDRNPRLQGPWKPSIFMPRAFSRIDLEVTAVRAERLQDISEEDAEAEGVAPVMPIGCNSPSYRAAFPALWDSINGRRAPWASSPWVWAISFKRVRP